MKSVHRPIVGLLLPALLGLTACSNDQVNLSAAPTPAESCQLALTLDHSFDHRADVDALRARVRLSDSADDWEQLGWRYVSLARDGEGSAALFLAGQTAACMLQREPDSVQAQLLQGNYRHQIHDFSGAEAIATELVQRRGGWYDYALLGDALIEQGRLHEAEAAYQSMVDIKPGAEAYGRIAHLRWLMDDQVGAMELMVLAIRAQSVRDHRAAAWWRTTLADYLFATDQIDPALTVVDDALSLHPASHAAHFLRARVLRALERNDEALAAMERAVSLNPLPAYQEMLADWTPSDGQVPQPFIGKDFSPRA